MRLLTAALLSLLLLPPVAVRAQEESPEIAHEEAADSHAELAGALVALLQRTAAALESCTDAATVSAALPELTHLREEAAQLMSRQAMLSEPTVQDYMAAQAVANDFQDAKHAIQGHIERLKNAGLLSSEIRRVLGIAPETPSSEE